MNEKIDIKQQLQGKDIYIYGFNEDGKRLLMGLLAQGIYVKGFVDECGKKDFKYLNKIVIAKDEVANNKKNIVLCINKNNAVNPQFVYFDYLKDIVNVSSYDLVINDGKNERLIFTQRMLHYIINRIVNNKKKFAVYGNSSYISEVVKRLRLLDIDVIYGLTSDDFEGIKDDVELKCPYDLLYEDTSEWKVWAIDGEEVKAREFIKCSGIDESIFSTSANGPYKISRQICFDPSLGYNLLYHGKKSIITYETSVSYGEMIKVGVLGGSTSDVTLYNEKSWPEQMIDIAEAKKINMKIYAGAVSGYASSHELIKLIRDMLDFDLDILISYSRVNDAPHTNACSEINHFIHPYQYELFEYLVDNHRGYYDYSTMTNDMCMGVETNNSYGEHWYKQERIMHAISKEFGIKFVAILPPFFYDKKPKTKYDIELSECLGYWKGLNEYYAVMKSISEIAKNNDAPWIVDFSNALDGIDGEVFFDAFHLTSEANMLIAEKILDIIKNLNGADRNE